MTSVKQYQAALQRWMPGARIGRARAVPAEVDAIATWDGPAGRMMYVIEVKRHLGTQDARLVAEQLRRYIQALPTQLRHARPLLVAPYIRPEQAAVLESAEVDFMDLAGNAHLEGPGLHVHVEGRKPLKEPAVRRGTITKGWVKTAMALLVCPELLQAPYRTIAAQADVALGTVVTCLRDLRARGIVRGPDERRELVNRQELLALWVEAYTNQLRPALKQRWLQVQVAEKAELWQRLQLVMTKHRVQWALTGADAAERLTKYFRAANTEIYATLETVENRELLKDLRAQPALRTGNVLIIEPPAPIAIDAAEMDRHVPLAPAELVYAELRYRGTEQALEAADQLLPRLTRGVAAANRAIRLRE